MHNREGKPMPLWIGKPVVHIKGWPKHILKIWTGQARARFEKASAFGNV